MIPDKIKKTFAAGTCQITIGSNNTTLRRCSSGQTLTVNELVVISRNWEMIDLETNTPNLVTINNSGTIVSKQSTANTIDNKSSTNTTINNYLGATIQGGYRTINDINAGLDSNLTIVNEGTIKSMNYNTSAYQNRAIESSGNNFNLTNSGAIRAKQYPVKADGDKFILNNSGTIEATSEDYAVSASGDSVEITNSGDITVSADNYGIRSTGADTIIINSGDITAEQLGVSIEGANQTLTNSGNIYGTTKKAIVIIADNATITNESTGLIRAGSYLSVDGLQVNAVLFNLGNDPDYNGTLENYGKITAAASTVKVGMENVVINNHSGATIQLTDDDVGTAAVQISEDNATITNKGTLIGTGTESHSIEVANNITGTKIYVDGAPTFTGEVELNNAAANTTVYLECNISQDTTIEIHNKPSLKITNNLCGNDTYTIQDSSQNADADNSETNGYLVIDEGLEVVSNNASYRSENVLTKLKGLFSAANYIDGVEPEDKFFRIFYSNVKRENMYKGSMAGVVGQLSPINWGNVTSNVFLGYSKHHGDFDNGEFLGGGNFALGLKNVFTKNGMKVSFSPMIGLNDLDVTDYDSDSTAKVKTNLLSEFLAVNGKIDKEIKTSEVGSLNLSVQSTLGLQRFPDYLSKFSDGDLSVDEAIEQVLSGGFEVKYNEELGKGFIIRPYVGVSLNHNLNDNIDIVKDDDSISASPADSVTSGYYAGLTLNKEAKGINFDLDLMYGNEDGLINQIAAVSFTKTFGQVKTAKLKKKSDTLKVDKSSTTQDYDKDLTELGELRKANETLKAKSEALKAQNEKLKLLAQKVLEENEASKKLIVELLKENEKIKLEKQMMTNQILESENKELLEQLKGSNEGNKPPVKFLIIFATIFVLATIGLTSIVASMYNRIMYRPARA